jgi:hypothetical protein
MDTTKAVEILKRAGYDATACDVRPSYIWVIDPVRCQFGGQPARIEYERRLIPATHVYKFIHDRT